MSDQKTLLYQAMVDHYSQQGLYGTVQKVCKSMGTPTFSFWHAYAVAMQASPTEAIRELSMLEGDPDCALAVTACLIQTHKMCESVDRKAVSKLKVSLRELSRSSDNPGLLLASRYFWHSKKEKQAKMCVEKVIQKDRRNTEALSLYGWICMTSSNPRQIKRSVTFFSTALKLDPKNLSSLAGRAQHFASRGDHTQALSDINQMIVSHKEYLPALAEKAKVLLSIGNWEESVQTAERILSLSPRSIEAHRVIALQALTQSGSPHTTAARIDDVKKAIIASEPKNHQLYSSISKLVARLSGRNSTLLRVSMKLANKAILLDPDNAEYATELAVQYMMTGDYTTALETFGRALKADEGYMPALHGRIRCKIELGKLGEAAEELEFMGDVGEEESAGSSLELAMLQALLAWKHKKNEKKTIQLLNSIVKKHKEGLVGCPVGSTFYVRYDPDFVMQVISLYMQFVGSERLTSYDPPSKTLKQCKDLLTDLARIVPGFSQAHTQLAHCCYICNEFSNAQRALDRLDSLDGKTAQGKVMLARIFLANEAYREAENALDVALSLDFDIKTQPSYFVIKARILEKRGQTEEALKLLKTALDLPGVRKISAKKPVAPQIRMSVFIDAAGCYVKLGKLPDATKIMTEAKTTFKKTGGTDRITLAEADLALQRGDVKRALMVLKMIRSSSDVYMSAKVRMAEIYLTHRKQKHLYAQCYQELVNKNPTLHNHMLLGQAYMRIQEPDQAIAAYEAARKTAPKDAKLSNVIGKALVATHDYSKATQYYELAVKEEPENVEIARDLSDLYRRLKHYGAATRTAQTALMTLDKKSQSDDMQGDVQDQIDKVSLFQLLASVYKDNQDSKQMQNALLSARRLQQSVLQRTKSTFSTEAYRKQVQIATKICNTLAQSYMKDRDSAQAKQFYDEALCHDETHEGSMLALARLSQAEGNNAQCEAQCQQLLQVNPDNREAMVMLSGLIFQKGDMKAAVQFFQQLLIHCPTEYTSMAKLIDLLRKAGSIEDAKKYIDNAKNAGSVASFNAGIHYCEGLYKRYTNDYSGALKAFNKARKDSQWGSKALENMIYIYLDPEAWDLFQDGESKADTNEVVAAEKLLEQLKSQDGVTLKANVMQAYCLMAMRSKPNIERAVESLRRLLSSSDQEAREYVPAVVAIARGLVMLKKIPKAKNFLKRVTRPQNHLLNEFQEEYEQGWGLMAQIYVQSGKNDMARKLCEKCITLNKGCDKAWELLGHIKEKELAYKDAAEHYEWAWKFSNESSANIGFKLAFNYLKAGRQIDAIDVCNKVLAKHPSYPRIEKEILEKARFGLRP